MNGKTYDKLMDKYILNQWDVPNEWNNYTLNQAEHILSEDDFKKYYHNWLYGTYRYGHRFYVPCTCSKCIDSL